MDTRAISSDMADAARGRAVAEDSQRTLEENKSIDKAT